MKTQLKISTFIYSAMAVILLASCVDNKPELEKEPTGLSGRAIRFNADIFNTKAVTDADFRTMFTVGDQIGVFAVAHAPGETVELASADNYLHNLKVIFDGTYWDPEDPVFFPTDGSELDFYAYYPYVDDPALDPKAVNFSVLADQKQIVAGCSAFNKSDFMTAIAKNVEADSFDVPLVFKHLLAMVQVRVSPEIGAKFHESFTVTLKGALPSTMINIVAPDGQKVSAASGEAIDINMIQADTEPGVNLFRAILPMQTLAAGELFVFAQTDPENQFEVVYTSDADDVLEAKKVSKYAISLTGIVAEPLHYFKVGDYYPDPNVDLADEDEKAKIEGVVFWIDPAYSNDGGITGAVGKIVGLVEHDIQIDAVACGLKWGPTSKETGATSRDDGRANTNAIAAYVARGAGGWYEFPIFYWVVNEVNGGDVNGKWFIPSKFELQYLYCAYVGAAPAHWDAGVEDNTPAPNEEASDAFNKLLTDAGGKPITRTGIWPHYWSSTERFGIYASSLSMTRGHAAMDEKSYPFRVRPIASFR